MEEKNAGNIIQIIAVGILKLLWVLFKIAFVVGLVLIMIVVEAGKPNRRDY